MLELLYAPDPAMPKNDPARLDLVTCTTPVTPGPVPQEVINEIRAEMQAAGAMGPVPLHLLSTRQLLASRVIRDELKRYVGDGAARAGRLYVLDFQGPGESQFVKFGYTTRNLRRISEHITYANTFGWVLLDGWISPETDKPKVVEQAALMAATRFHNGILNYRETFYGMDFQLGLKIARTAFELEANLSNPDTAEVAADRLFRIFSGTNQSRAASLPTTS